MMFLKDSRFLQESGISKLVKKYQELIEFVAPLPIQRIFVSMIFKRDYDYSSGHVSFNRFMADEFKKENRYENKDEFKTMFSQAYR